MATQAAFQEQYDRLHHLVQGWDRRARVQQTLLWLPRSLLPGLVAGIALFVAARFVPLRPAAELAALTALLALAGLLVMLAWVWLRPRSALASARRFDLEFHLGERISTALELIEGRIESTDELTGFQIEDAWSRGQVVKAGDMLPLKSDRRAWTVVLLAVIALVILYMLPNPQTPVTSQRTGAEVAIEAAAEEVERITQELAADTRLSDEDRQALLEQLNQTRQILRDEQVSPEEAFASLSDSQAQLQERAESLNQQMQAQQSALQQAAQTIQDAGSPAAQQQAQQQEAADAIPTLDQLRQSMDGMSEAQRQQMADALEQAAAQLEQTNPEAAQALRDAAEALRNGDMEAAQQALQEAMQALQEQQQAQQQQQQSAQQMQQQSQQLQQSASQIAQQSQQGQPQMQQGQQSSQQNAQQQQEAGIQPLQQPGQQSQQEGQQSGEQPGDQQGMSAQASDQAGSQDGQTGDSAMGQPGGQPIDQPGSTQADQPGVGSGAGDQQGDAGQDSAGGPQAGQVQQNNNPDGEGVGEFSPVYAPQRVGGQGEEQIFLEPDTSDVPVQEGEFSQNPTGQSLVPYNQVFSDYSNAANRALNQDYIPLGLRDVVRDYFSSLEPRR